MNQNLLKYNHEVIPNFISSIDAKNLAEEFKVNDNYFKFKGSKVENNLKYKRQNKNFHRINL